VVIAAVLAATPLSAIYLSETIAADSCLDGDGSYDYTHRACDHQVNHSYVPFGERHPGLLIASSVGLVLAGTLTAILNDRLGSRQRQSR